MLALSSFRRIVQARMKAVLSALVLASLSPWAQAAARPTPQPRIRLQPGPTGSTARLEEKVAGAPETTVAMEKMTVRDSKLPSPPQPLSEEELTSFSFIKGGPLLRKRIGPAALEIGMWRWTDLMSDDARYKAPATRVEFNFVRLKR